ncbi:hypothetical protein ACH5RR_018337 [Cinchona calisaya]|uniref:Uncharacterized protein n=1 Tax=Cinchona calisaya TaxID=153742 RepID=A0ABD2ZRA4_9GENT
MLQENKKKIVGKAVCEWLKFDEAEKNMKQDKNLSRNIQTGCETALPPAEGIIKINIDAALDGKKIRTGWVMMARNWKEDLQETWACSEDETSDANIEEANSLFCGANKKVGNMWISSLILRGQ